MIEKKKKKKRKRKKKKKKFQLADYIKKGGFFKLFNI